MCSWIFIVITLVDFISSTLLQKMLSVKVRLMEVTRVEHNNMEKININYFINKVLDWYI